jgi:hypothetical protein
VIYEATPLVVVDLNPPWYFRNPRRMLVQLVSPGLGVRKGKLEGVIGEDPTIYDGCHRVSQRGSEALEISRE